MKKLFIILLCLSVLVAFNISSFAYFPTYDFLNQKSYLPELNFTFDVRNQGIFSYAEDLSVYGSDVMLDVIDNDLFESGDYIISSNSFNAFSSGLNGGIDVFLDQNIVLAKILTEELEGKYDYQMSREYILDEYITYGELYIRSPIVKITPEWNDLCVYIQNNQGIRVLGGISLYTATENGYDDSVFIPIDYSSSDDYIYFGDIINLFTDDYSFDLCDFYFYFSWQPVIDNGVIQSSYNRVHFYIPISYSDVLGWGFNGVQPLDINDLVVNVQSINDFNFLEWLANSVQSFFSVTLFRIGSVPVSVGVCMLVPLSLSILIGFLKKFSGG